jgi:orotidine-5'-phosphate decarboxylase
MIRQAVQAKNRPKLWGVTVLTSFDDAELKNIGVQRSVNEQVMYLAGNGKTNGLDGVISSVSEAKQLKAAFGKSFQVVTPGIRLTAGGDDQKRVDSPAGAIAAGVDFFVMGRPILEAKDPVEFVKTIYQSFEKKVPA